MQKSPINEKVIKNLLEKAKMKSLSDEIELKDIQIKESIKCLNNIKISALKEFVYANRSIPDSWKKKFNYQKQILELFVRDKKFLSYVGNGSGSNETKKIGTKLYKPKYKLKKNINNDRPYSYRARNYTDKIPEETSFPTSSRNYSSLNTKNKLKYNKNQTVNEKEINNVLDSLRNDFPIKGKLSIVLIIKKEEIYLDKIFLLI